MIQKLKQKRQAISLGKWADIDGKRNFLTGMQMSISLLETWHARGEKNEHTNLSDKEQESN